jgi:hypothetical protein
MAEHLDLNALERANLGKVVRPEDWMALLAYARGLESAIKRQANAVRTLRNAELDEARIRHQLAEEAMRATSPEALTSEREANAILTAEVERLEARVRELEGADLPAGQGADTGRLKVVRNIESYRIWAIREGLTTTTNGFKTWRAAVDAVRALLGDRAVNTAAISADSAANGGQCGCRACSPVSMNMRMVLCPSCGNKRCPRASDHRNACTGSNEPGQPGSAYPTV